MSQVADFEMKILALGVFFVSFVSAQICSKDYPVWSVENGDILLNGSPFHIKGTSWFGFETGIAVPHGLWSYSMDHILSSLDEGKLDINAIRLPFSVDAIVNNKVTTSCSGESSLCGIPTIDAMEIVIDELASRNILVMLDQHTLSADQISNLWYSDTYDESTIVQSWETLMDRFAGKWNVFALDLKNEPHGEASWGKGDSSTDWNIFAEDIIHHIADKYPEYKGLFFVEGVQEEVEGGSTEHNHWWGGNMEGVWNDPIDTGNEAFNNRVVYSPHVYGPSVYAQPYFSDSNFPDNMPDIWDTHFGFVEEHSGNPIVVGEWGGKYAGDDQIWQDAFADYLVENCMSDNFYWSLNPNSGDTGGLLGDDWTTIDSDKAALIDRVQPYPSRLAYDAENGYCFYPGSRANSACGEDVSIESTTTSEPTTGVSTTTDSQTTSACECVCTTGSTTSGTMTTTTNGASTTTTQSTTPSSQDGLDTVIETITSWGSGSNKNTQLKVKFTNNYESQNICSIQMTVSPNSVEVKSFSNFGWISGDQDASSGVFETASWLNLSPNGGDSGGAFQVTYLGTVEPSLEVTHVGFC